MNVVTVAEFSEQQKIDYVTAKAILDFMVVRGKIQKCKEKRPSPSGKGKPSNLYNLGDAPITLIFEKNS